MISFRHLAWVLLGCALSGMLTPLRHAAASPVAPTNQRTVMLTTRVDIENKGTQDIPQHIFRLTLPVDTPPQQRVLDVTLPSQGNFSWATHPNQVDRYVQGKLSLKANATTQLIFKTRLRLAVTDWRIHGGDTRTAGNANFLRPTTFVESTAPDILQVASQISTRYASDEARLRAAFDYPQATLRYTADVDNRGALFALRQRYGDCTEYAALFAATARAMGYPARLSSEFHFEPGEDYAQPNHHAAEVFVNQQWIAVDPNLATNPRLGYGFGTTATSKIILKRDGSWVWASVSPGVSKAYRDGFIRTRLSWRVESSD